MPIEFTYGRPPVIEEIRASVARTDARKRKAGMGSMLPPQGPDAGLLRVKPAAEWMKQQYGKPMPRMLFGEFWFEGELCILFADTNVGKSILAVQIGNNIVQEASAEPFYTEMEAGTPVLYIDFELGAKQFESRYYSKEWGSYNFMPNFFRAEFNPEGDDPLYYDSFDEYLRDAIKHAIIETKAQIVIIDNLTYMRSGTERAKDALPLMKQLKALKSKYKLSILALAHTPKRDASKPLGVNDLQGSKMLINFCDSAFAIGESYSTPGGRYIKQIKQRNLQKRYGEGHVCLCHIHNHLNFLRFEFDAYVAEYQHLKNSRNQDKTEIRKQILELRDTGFTYRQIHEKLRVGNNTIRKVLSE